METKLRYELAQVYQGYLISPFEVESGWQCAIFAPEGESMWGNEQSCPTAAEAIAANKPLVDEYERQLQIDLQNDRRKRHS